MGEETVSEPTIEERVADVVLGVKPEESEEPVKEPEPVIEGEPDLEAEPEPETELQFVELELNGKTYEVPVELKEGYMLQADYTQKTQSLADQRREVALKEQQVAIVEAEQTFVKAVESEVDEIRKLNYQLDQWEQYLSANAREMDSQTLTLAQLEIRNGEKQRDEKTEALKHRYTEHQHAQQQTTQELLQKGTDVLKKAIPDWGPDKQKEMHDYAVSIGIPKEQVDSIVDPLHVQILYENAQYRKIQSGIKGAVKQVETAQTIQPKSRNPMPEDVKRKLNLRKKIKDPKLSSRAKARLIQETMGERFG